MERTECIQNKYILFDWIPLSLIFGTNIFEVQCYFKVHETDKKLTENLKLLFLVLVVVVAHLRSMLHMNLASCVANNLCTKLVVCA